MSLNIVKKINIPEICIGNSKEEKDLEEMKSSYNITIIVPVRINEIL